MNQNYGEIYLENGAILKGARIKNCRIFLDGTSRLENNVFEDPNLFPKAVPLVTMTNETK